MPEWAVHLLLGVVGTIMAAAMIGMFRVLVQMRDTLLRIAPQVEEMREKVGAHETWLVQMRAKLGFDSVRIAPPQS